MLRLNDYGTDRDRFVSLLLRIKALNPKAYEVMRLQMRALIGKVRLNAEERAELARRFLAAIPASKEATAIAADLDQHIAKVAAS